VIVDANIVVYWCVPGPFARTAERILGQPNLCAPSLIRAEAASGILKYLRAGLIGMDQMFSGIATIDNAIPAIVEDGHLVKSAIELALSERHSVYDCMYLALALERREPIATADRELALLAAKTGVGAELIEPEA
jgi:predicted nucleic acid-binding protein